MKTAAGVDGSSTTRQAPLGGADDRRMPWLATALGLAAAYLAVGEVGTRLSYPGVEAPLILPAAGIAVGALLLGGVRLWPGIAVGQLLLGWLHGASLLEVISITVGHTLAAALAASLLARAGSFDSRLARPRDMLILAAVGGALSTILVGLGHAGAGYLSSAGAEVATLGVFVETWLAATMGVMVLTPLLLVWRTPWPRTTLLELLSSFVLLIASTAVSFGHLVPAHERLPLAFAPFPFLIWIAMRQGLGGAAVAVALVAAGSLLGTLAGHGPFEGLSFIEGVAMLWSFTAIVALTVMVVAAANAQQAMSRQRLADREARMRAILDAAVDAIVTVDERGRIESFNRAAETMFGCTFDEAKGAKLTTLIARSDVSACEELLATRPGRGPSGQVVELAGRRRDGTTFPVRVSVGQMPAARRRGGKGRKRARLALIIHDATERNRLEAELRQSQKMEAVGTLASGVAHDFNNLLMGILGCAELSIAELEPGSAAHQRVGELKAAALGGRSIVSQLMAFGRKREARAQVFSLDATIRDTQAMLRRLLGEDVALRLKLGADKARVRIPPGHIEQVLMNLVVNARQAMPHGGDITVTTALAIERDGSAARADAKAQPGDGVTLRVSDTGIGMDQETQARAFEPFFTTRSALDGTGLGLSTIYGIVTRAGGHITLESEISQGTSVVLWFPLAALAVEEVDATVDEREEHRGSGRILLVEDDPLVRRTIRRYLLRLGFEVLDAEDGVSALTLLRELKEPLDALLTDMVLPHMSGPMVAEDVHALCPEAAVIFMSAHSLASLANRRLPPVTPSLQKPFTLAELTSALREAIPHCFEPTAAASSERASASGPPPAPADEGGTTAAPADGARKTILLVEDHQLTRHAITKLLGDAYEVLAAKNAAEARALCSEQDAPVDLVVTDVGLPDLRGDELMVQLRDAGRADQAVFMSGRSREDPEVAKAVADPRAVFLEKPVDFDDLERTIEEALAEVGSRAGAR